MSPIERVIEAARDVEHRCREAFLLLEVRAPLTVTGEMAKDGAADAIGRLHQALAAYDSASKVDHAVREKVFDEIEDVILRCGFRYGPPDSVHEIGVREGIAIVKGAVAAYRLNMSAALDATPKAPASDERQELIDIIFDAPEERGA